MEAKKGDRKKSGGAIVGWKVVVSAHHNSRRVRKQGRRPSYMV